MIKEDCFAYRKRGNTPTCNALNEYEPLICRYKEKSTFYKTKEEFEKGLKILEEREAKRKGEK